MVKPPDQRDIGFAERVADMHYSCGDGLRFAYSADPQDREAKVEVPVNPRPE
jgi:hypothetical protein